MAAGGPCDIGGVDPDTSRKAHPSFVRFRAWRESTLPLASYVIAPAFWTPAGLARAAAVEPIVVPVTKRREPTLTGLTYSARAVYLVVAAKVATYEQIAKLIHCRILMRDDPDYQEHRGKRVCLVMLCDNCPPAVLDFARRHRVRVIEQGAQNPTEIGTRTGISFESQITTAAIDVLESFSP